MDQINQNKIKISVRDLVEFILRSGDLDNRIGGRKDTDAMQEGSRIHRKIQKRMGSNYTAEFPLSITIPYTKEDINFEICVEGRADGIINNADGQEEENFNCVEEQEEENLSCPQEVPKIVIDEIKAVYRELSFIQEPVPVHRAQAMCYAYIYSKLYQHDSMGIRITYCNIETENMKYFEERFSFQELEAWFFHLIREYGKWAAWQCRWKIRRDESIKNLEFPFEYRPGQKKLVTDVYKTILREKRLFLEAPTGVGKTISTLYPAVKAMGEGILSKLFYLTAKTITRTVAEETIQHLTKKGLSIKCVTITAKDKICILDKPDCNPMACPRAKGHFDRVNDAVFDLLRNEDEISRESIITYAEKYMVCPFEMCLDVTSWADCIICDYNYAFDPNVYLRRFFQGGKNDYAFLIDEAHNLVERAKEMYSAILYKKQFLAVRKLVKGKHGKLEKGLQNCNDDLLKMKRECEECSIKENISDFVLHLMRLLTEFDEFLQENTLLEGREECLQLYFDIRHFLNIYEVYNDKYITYTDYDEQNEFRIKLLCMDPSTNLNQCLEKGKSSIFFSATLLPIQYYKEQLAGREEDYAVYAPSPFRKENRLLMIGKDVSTKYTRRNDSEYKKILEYILKFTSAKIGNYMVFFPSYQIMNQVANLADNFTGNIVVQTSNMSEIEKEKFLEEFTAEPEKTRIGFCVMGGIFSEGIDLKNDRLIGSVIVGTGLPMIGNERELFRNYYDEINGRGFDYAYLYQGMNKVLQSAGRVIRTMEDKGAILLLDERFEQKQYLNLFPREWFPYIVVDSDTVEDEVTKFWNSFR
jgi:Rad3-related DNA helicase